MATAEKKTVTREVVKTEEVEVIHLKLSREEAESVAVLLGHVSGSQTRSRRGHTDAVMMALSDAGIHWHHPNPAYESLSANGEFQFADEDDLSL